MAICLEEMGQGPWEREVEWDEVRVEEEEGVFCGKAAEERPVHFPTGFVYARNVARKFLTNPENPAQRCNVPSVDR